MHPEFKCGTREMAQCNLLFSSVPGRRAVLPSELHRVAAGERLKEFFLVDFLALHDAFLPLREFVQN